MISRAVWCFLQTFLLQMSNVLFAVVDLQVFIATYLSWSDMKYHQVLSHPLRWQDFIERWDLQIDGQKLIIKISILDCDLFQWSLIFLVGRRFNTISTSYLSLNLEISIKASIKTEWCRRSTMHVGVTWDSHFQDNILFHTKCQTELGRSQPWLILNALWSKVKNWTILSVCTPLR